MSLIKVRIPAKAADAGNFKVGDKVLRKGYPAPSPRDYYKVIEVHPNGSVMLDDGFNGYYSPNLIIRATDSNAGAQDAKFKVGQRVKIDRKDATITKTNAEGQWNYYYFKFDGDPRERGVFESEISANSRANDAADADKSEELEREIKGDVVAVVSGNAARVSKDVPFATAKEGVESFARKNGVSVVASQEYGEAYKFKFSAAIDCAADSADALDYDPRYANPQAEEKFKAKIREYGKAHGGSLKGITSGDVIKWAKEIGCENYVVPWQDAIGYFRYGKGKGEFATY